MRLVSVLVALCVAGVAAVAVGGAPPDLEKLVTPTEDLLVPPDLALSDQPTPNACQRYPLLVTFADLGWGDWIIAPSNYDAGYCSGICLPSTLPNTTNHAIVQALVNNVQNTIPKPCCVPTELKPLSVLYLSDESNLVLTKYKNMIVKSCGCH